MTIGRRRAGGATDRRAMSLTRFARFWIAAVLTIATAFAASAMAASPAGSEVRATSTIPAIALVAGLAWTEAERPAGLDPGDVYVYRPDFLVPSRVSVEVETEDEDAAEGKKPERRVLEAILSPVGDFLAVRTQIDTAASGAGASAKSALAVVVVDTTGEFVAEFPGGVRFAWRPDGTALAVAHSRTDDVAFDSVFVFDLKTHGARGFHLRRCEGALAWDGATHLLAEPSPAEKPLVIDWSKGSVRPAKKRGTDFSPDRSYSIARTKEGWGLFDGSGSEITAKAQRASNSSGAWTAIAWLAYPGEGHLVAVSPCDGAGSCLIDVKRMRVVGTSRGRLLGASSERANAVVFHDREIRFLSRKDWEPVQPSAAK